MKLKVFDTAGKELREIDAADEVFGIEPNRSVLHQAYVAQMGNRRSGQASTKSRGEVAGSTVKIRKQKGLGRSRQGSIRASHHVGGGVAFGPKPHSFAKDLPRTMRRLAIRSALSSHAASGTLLVIEGLSTPDAKTRSMQNLLNALGVERRALVVTGAHVPEVTRSARNIDIAKALPAQNLNVVDLINAHRLVMSEDAIRACESLWGGANLKPQRGRAKEAVV
ncbi:MAG: 50S ribosomal protein L4 [Dehalococcoidia bacterium]|jgi:large subunit ribosomal protein L4|uniref:50S ribosomal protein L4 n=1 Tax=Candidatus Amarobacter glycogenicus TaxID=3140699 RepID=UPI002A0BF905|nr:50S ribosomal protein L4 [Dehalococcoidia bacterium]MBK6563462.1 50S ribosomal protein L4 [Dehalococcoidia bacterium]MBK7127549.1 50S ribosomal protein L4 [Dehalococcoidia bacterium]MBK7330261.1 50S ribosomal protein L4 [Dehalococcoidia bacterium]MBK8560113.1 50S ribosomal protein L4 [Dehalococcoidia bacterium]